MRGHLLTHVFFGGDASHHDGRRSRKQQARQLRDQAVTNRQDREDLRRIRRRHLMLHDADHKATEDIDEEDQNPSHGIAAHKFTRAIHRAIKIRFLRNFCTALFGFFLGNDPRVHVRIDRHLFAGHRVQREARTDFRDAPGALGHHHKINDHEDRKHHQPDRVIAADHEFAEGANNLPRRVVPGMAMEQNHAGRGDVERKSEQGRDQHHTRK